MSKNYCKKISETSARIGEVRFSYTYLFEPRKDDDGENGKYSMCVLIPKTDTATINLVKEIIEAAKLKGKNSKWGGKIPGRLGMPLRDGDEEDKGEEFEGMMFFNCSAKNKPGVRILDNGRVVEALDESDVYAGAWGAITINAFPYDSNGNKGVGIGLNNVIKTRDDERLAGGTNADQDFADMADDPLG